jgi:hypothetical protein
VDGSQLGKMHSANLSHSTRMTGPVQLEMALVHASTAFCGSRFHTPFSKSCEVCSSLMHLL